MGLGSDAENRLTDTFFDPFFNWDDDARLREWLRGQDADELEQFLEWFNFDSRRDRLVLGRQELKGLRNPASKLGGILSEGRGLLRGSEPVGVYGDFERWVNKVARWLEHDLQKPALSATWCGLPYSPLVTGSGYRNDEVAWTRHRDAVSSRMQWLGHALTPPASSETMQKVSSSTPSRKVFIVHGHDEAARETVARYIQSIGLEPIILHERTNKGRTIITKFREEAADVAFAVVLMTPDDQGAKAGAETNNPRARQNVVFELGFFIGALGPEKVSALVKGNVEKPSDFEGVVYISMEHGHWKIDLAKEFKAAGIEIDFNKVMGA